MFLKMFKQDVQRWIVPEEISDPALVTWSRTLRLLYRWMSLRAMLWFRFGSWFVPFRGWIHLLLIFICRRADTNIGHGPADSDGPK